MVSISKKVIAKLRTPTGMACTTAILCPLIAAAVWLLTTSSAQSLPPWNSLPGVLLAFAAEDPGELEGKLTGSSDFPITITVDGESRVATISGGTVADTLSDKSVHVGAYDLVTPPLTHQLEEFDEIIVKRRKQELYQVEDQLPYETFYYYSPEVTPGEEELQVAGEPGLRVETYAQMIYRGEADEEILVSREIVKQPVHEKIHIGFQSLPISPLDFQWTFDDSGEPADYVSVLRSRKSAGYSAPSGARTASGLPAVVGHVAVNPNEIPYGSKLFIQSPDGKFVYGYAIAADTGTALRQNKITVDLFYATYSQSAANGIREVDIFVLE